MYMYIYIYTGERAQLYQNATSFASRGEPARTEGETTPHPAGCLAQGDPLRAQGFHPWRLRIGLTQTPP